MAEIELKSVKKHLADTPRESFPQACLIYGEEFLYKSALDMVVDAFLGQMERSLGYEAIDGANENIPRAVESVNTYGLMSGAKVVALRDARIFYTKQDKDSLVEKAKKAAENNELKKASGFFLTLLNRLNLDLEDLAGPDRAKHLGLDSNEDISWTDKLLDYCSENRLNPSAEKDMADVLVEAIEKGFPEENFLVVTSDMVDRRHRLYKAFLKHGWVVNCSVPKGERRADKLQQEAVLNERMRAILDETGKSITTEAYKAVLEMVGFSPRAFSGDIEKLINYIGTREQITIQDVKAVLKRSRKDPIFEFTNAVTDRNIEKALFYFQSMLDAEMHPLQLLAAMVNQVRRLICVKGFTEGADGGIWHRGASYAHFQNKVLPALKKYDTALVETLRQWEEQLEAKEESSEGKKSKKKKTSAAKSTDLLVAKNPNNPFPIYQTLKKSDNFTMEELRGAVKALLEADLALKTSGQNPKRVLERVLFRICVKGLN